MNPIAMALLIASLVGLFAWTARQLVQSVEFFQA